MIGAVMTMTGAGMFAAGAGLIARGGGLFDIVTSQYSDWYSVNFEVVQQ
jgi:hypothetical protein